MRGPNRIGAIEPGCGFDGARDDLVGGVVPAESVDRDASRHGCLATGAGARSGLTSRPRYVLHVGQTRWDCFGEPHCSHVETRGAAMPCCARRLSRRDLEVFRFGTAMSGRRVYLSFRGGPMVPPRRPPQRRSRSSHAWPTGRRQSQPPAQAGSAIGHVRAERLERRPTRIGRRHFVLVRLEVQVLPADGAETRAIGAAEDLVRDVESDEVTHPGADVEVAVDEVLRPQLLVPPGSTAWYSRASTRRSTPAGARQRMHGPSSRIENASRNTSPLTARWTTSSAGTSPGVGDVRLTAERQRLDRHRERLTVLLAGSKSKRAEREAGHPARVAPSGAGTRTPACGSHSSGRGQEQVKLP